MATHLDIRNLVQCSCFLLNTEEYHAGWLSGQGGSTRVCGAECPKGRLVRSGCRSGEYPGQIGQLPTATICRLGGLNVPANFAKVMRIMASAQADVKQSNRLCPMNLPKTP